MMPSFVVVIAASEDEHEPLTDRTKDNHED